jgi:hypothetical protein
VASSGNLPLLLVPAGSVLCSGSRAWPTKASSTADPSCTQKVTQVQHSHYPDKPDLSNSPTGAHHEARHSLDMLMFCPPKQAHESRTSGYDCPSQEHVTAQDQICIDHTRGTTRWKDANTSVNVALSSMPSTPDVSAQYGCGSESDGHQLQVCANLLQDDATTNLPTPFSGTCPSASPAHLMIGTPQLSEHPFRYFEAHAASFPGMCSRTQAPGLGHASAVHELPSEQKSNARCIYQPSTMRQTALAAHSGHWARLQDMLVPRAYASSHRWHQSNLVSSRMQATGDTTAYLNHAASEKGAASSMLPRQRDDASMAMVACLRQQCTHTRSLCGEEAGADHDFEMPAKGARALTSNGDHQMAGPLGDSKCGQATTSDQRTALSRLLLPLAAKGRHMPRLQACLYSSCNQPSLQLCTRLHSSVRDEHFTGTKSHHVTTHAHAWEVPGAAALLHPSVSTSQQRCANDCKAWRSTCKADMFSHADHTKLEPVVDHCTHPDEGTAVEIDGREARGTRVAMARGQLWQPEAELEVKGAHCNCRVEGGTDCLVRGPKLVEADVAEHERLLAIGGGDVAKCNRKDTRYWVNGQADLCDTRVVKRADRMTSVDPAFIARRAASPDQYLAECWGISIAPPSSLNACANIGSANGS